MSTEVNAALVASAQAGDQRALDALAAQYLPLVYNIVGRALAWRVDVDDVVQETMLRVVRSLGTLRDPERFRAWLVAVTMNEIREHYQPTRVRLEPLDEVADVADPGADFADLTLTELGLSGQRREVVEATRWLDTDDRELLSLWWLVVAGHLTRADLITAVGLDAHHVTVRVARMKAQLEVARTVVRALTASPRCAGLADTANEWHGRPEPLWRKRFARHIRDCDYCSGSGADLIPAERLLVNLSLVPLPPDYLTSLLAHTHHSVPAAATATRLLHRLRAVRHGLTTKPLLAAATVAAAAGASVLTLQAFGAPATTGKPQAAATASPSSVPSPALLSPTVPQPPGTTRAASSAAPKKTASTAAKPSTSKPAGPLSPEDQVFAVINRARADHGVPPVSRVTNLNSGAVAHNRVMAGGCGLQHECPNEPSFADRTPPNVYAAECIGQGNGVANTTKAIADMAVGLTNGMLAEKPPNDGHRWAILASRHHYIGIAVLRDKGGNVWLTMDFTS